MFEIKKMFDEHKCKFLNAELKWGASWQDYQIPEYIDEVKKALEKGKKIIGIELRDFPEENGYYLIDHHNEKENNLSSIEQIATLIGVELTFDQRLIAANDKGHKAAMYAMGATWEEVEDIRKRDRKAQGVTKKDEKTAAKNIEDKDQVNDITLIQTTLSNFSPILDQLPGYRKLIIWNESELVFYGSGKPKVVKKYQQLIDRGLAYYGGGERGFFGLAKGGDPDQPNFSKAEIDAIKEELVQEMQQELLYSHHVFLFPFKWRHALENSYDLKVIERALSASQWKARPYQLVDEHGAILEHYNEYNYFYDHVREILYDQATELRSQGNNEASRSKDLLRHFEYQLDESKDWHYYIEVEGGQVYSLLIDSILLNAYATGVAVLSFHLRNFKYPCERDIFKINAFGRKILPPYFGLSDLSAGMGTRDDTPMKSGLLETKQNELAHRIWLDESETSFKAGQPFHEDFSAYHDPKNIRNGPFRLPAFISGLFPDDFFMIYGNTNQVMHQIKLEPVVDERMFVVSWLGNESFIAKVKPWCEEKNQYRYIDDKDWYKYVFADGASATVQSRTMQPQLLSAHTYDRWVDWGTLFGITRYSFVMLTGDFDKIPTFLVRHLQTIYYKMAELCLIQRASVLSFADEVTHVSNQLNEKTRHQEMQGIREQITQLYRRYIVFINKIYFSEITSHDQGIELYDMLQKHMRIPEQVKSLDGEINELHQYVSLESEKSNARMLSTISLLGAIFLPLTLMVGVFGMNTMPEAKDIPSNLFSPVFYKPFWNSIGITLLFTSVLTFLFHFFIQRSEKSFNAITMAIILNLLAALALVLPYLDQLQ